jgi:hypothetical protein
MTEEHSAAHRAFLNQLQELREHAGNPPLSHLDKLSRQPLPNGKKRRVLASSTTQEILNGKRRRLPSWAWMVSYVVTCHEAAEEGHLDIGPVDLEDWKSRWRHARNADEAATTPDNRPGTDSPWGGPAATARTEQLTAEETIRCYRDTHGRVGAHLARLATNGDADACFQLALLTLLRGWVHDGTIWLRRAVDAGHADAIVLQDSRDLRTEAAAFAYRHGCKLEADDKTSIASFFYRLAAETGHPQAIEKLARMAPQPHAQPSTTPLPAPVGGDLFADLFAEGFLRSRDEDFPGPFASRPGTPGRETPPMNEAVSDARRRLPRLPERT